MLVIATVEAVNVGVPLRPRNTISAVVVIEALDGAEAASAVYEPKGLR